MMRRNLIKSASLFLSILTVFSFSACSNDDGPGTEELKEPVDTYLSITATPETLTRSTKDTEVQFDKFVHTLTALVFTEAGEFYAKKTVSSDDKDDQSISEITDISVKVLPNYENPEAGSSTKFQVVLIANEGVSVNYDKIKNIEDLSTKITTPSIETLGKGNAYLPMSSAVLTVTGLKYSGDTKNWIDGNNTTVKYEKQEAEPVTLTRLVSQVKLGKVAVKFSSDFYKDASFIIDEIYLVNVRKDAYYLPSSINKTDIQDATDKQEGESYENAMSDFLRGGPAEFTSEDLLIANDVEKSTYNSKYALSLQEEVLKNNESISTPFDKFTPYVYPSVIREGEYQTRLVLSCRYRFQEALVYTQKYFHVVIGDMAEFAGEKPEQTYSGIVANSVYTIEVTISGEGSPTPDKYVPTAELTVNMTVEPWTVEHQNEED